MKTESAFRIGLAEILRDLKEEWELLPVPDNEPVTSTFTRAEITRLINRAVSRGRGRA